MPTYEYERVRNKSQPEVTYTQALLAFFPLKLAGIEDIFSLVYVVNLWFITIKKHGEITYLIFIGTLFPNPDIHNHTTIVPH